MDIFNTSTNKSMQFSNLWAPSSALASLRTLQPRALRLLNCIDPLVSVPNLLCRISQHDIACIHAAIGPIAVISINGNKLDCKLLPY